MLHSRSAKRCLSRQGSVQTLPSTIFIDARLAPPSPGSASWAKIPTESIHRLRETPGAGEFIKRTASSRYQRCGLIDHPQTPVVMLVTEPLADTTPVVISRALSVQLRS